MKRCLFLLVFAIGWLGAFANVAPPQAYISEVFIDSAGNWTIELGFYIFDFNEIDSIKLETSSGSSIVHCGIMIPGQGWPGFDSLTLVTNENLVDPLNLDGNGDLVKVCTYALGLMIWDSIVFGDYPNSTLPCIRQGESVSFILYEQSAGSGLTGGFCIDLSPTIGLDNDTTGALGTFQGTAYDTSGAVFTEGWFPLPGIWNTAINIRPDGSFSERICARRIKFDTIIMHFPPWPYDERTYTIEPVDFCLRPDSTFHQDIITTGVVTGIHERSGVFENSVTVSPNPFRSAANFYFNPQQFGANDDLQFFIYDQAGRQLVNVALTRDQYSYQWIPSSSAGAGLYYFTLQRNHHPVKTGKLIRLQN